MRRFALALAACLLASIAAANTGDAGWTPVETVKIADDRGAAYTFIIETRGGDPTATRLRYNTSGGESGDATIGGGIGPLWTPLTPNLEKRNTVRSAYVLVGPPAAALGGARLAVVVGRQYEGDAGSVLLFSLKDGRLDAGLSPKTNLVDVAWTTNGPELIALRAWRQSAGACRATYDPYNVLTTSMRNGRPWAARSAAESQAYNLAHYVWAGPDARSDVTVDTCGRRPKLVKQPAA